MEPGRISRSQAVYLVCMAILGTATLELPGSVIAVAGRDAWISVFLSSLVTLVPAGLWLWVASRFPGKDLFETARAASGRVVGFAICLLLTVWVFTLVTGAVSIGADLIILNFLPETPEPVVVASIVIPAAMAAHARLEVVARLNQVVFWTIVVLIVSYIPLSAQDGNLQRLQPVLSSSPQTLIKAVVVPIGILSESFILAAVLPYLKTGRRAWPMLLVITAAVAVMIALLTAWSVAVFGPYLPARFHHPVLKMSHIISLADILERLDALVIALWVAGVVAKSAFWYWLLCLGVARTFGLKDYRPLAWPLAFLVGFGGVHWSTQANEYDAGLASWTTITLMLVGMALPLALLAMDMVSRWTRRVASG